MRTRCACLESLAGVETVVVDNGSADGSPEAIEERFPDVELIRAGVNLGFAAGCNVGIRRALDHGADWVVLVNNDSTVAPDLVDALTAAAARHPDAGALAGKVYVAEPPDVLWYAGGSFEPRLGYSGRVRGSGKRDDGSFDEERDVDWGTGALLAVSRGAIDRVGLLDEELFAYLEDVDWCLRIRDAGLRVVFVPSARSWHRVSASTGGAASTDEPLLPLPQHACGLRAASPADARPHRRPARDHRRRPSRAGAHPSEPPSRRLDDRPRLARLPPRKDGPALETFGCSTLERAVHRLVPPRRLRPREPRRPLEPRRDEPLRALQHSGDDRRDVLGVGRVEERRRVAAGLGERAGVRRGDRAAARHRLERRIAEALVQAREDEAGGATVERDELVDGDQALDGRRPPEPAGPRGRRP